MGKYRIYRGKKIRVGLKALISDFGGKKGVIEKLVDGDIFDVDEEEYTQVRYILLHDGINEVSAFERTDTGEIVWTEYD